MAESRRTRSGSTPSAAHAASGQGRSRGRSGDARAEAEKAALRRGAEMRRRKAERERKRRKKQLQRRITVIVSVLLIALVLAGVVLSLIKARRAEQGTAEVTGTSAGRNGADGSGGYGKNGTGYAVSGLTSAENSNNHDADGDGIPDQEDIFESAKAYVATKPYYQDKYYAEGYPDDGQGVCTDVIGFAFLGAGFDLRQLVAEDIRDNPDDYSEVETPDSKIDFRRVPNLTVYFTHTAQVLTTDFNDTKEWLPGDIVTWPHHIGIISDRKNARGIPYVIHHAGKKQTEYEEDILEGTSHYTYVREITGHFRVK